MIPSWLISLSRLTPVLFFLSFGLIIFGGYKLFMYLAKRSEEREEEERKRKEFLAKMKFSPASKTSPGKRL